MIKTEFPREVLPTSQTENEAVASPDKRLVGERNRLDVLKWLSRFGWLTSRMLAALIWSDAAQAQAMARRTLKALIDDKLIITRPLAKGGAAYLLSASGARLLTEQTGLEAASGNSLAVGNPIHRACSNWYLIRAVQRGLDVVTEHEIATERGPCRVVKGKQADGIVIFDGGACAWVECENSAKSRPERHKTVALVEECIGNERMVELGQDLWLARLVVVAANTPALRWMSSSFQDAHRQGRLRDSQVAEIDVCLLPVSESLVPGEAIDGNMYWDILVPAMA